MIPAMDSPLGLLFCILGPLVLVAVCVFPFIVIARLNDIRKEACSTNMWLERLDWHLQQMHKASPPKDLPEPPEAGRGVWPG